MLEEVWYTVDGERTLAYKYSYASNGALLVFEDCLNGDITYYTYTKHGQLQSVNTYNENDELTRSSVYFRYDEANGTLEYTCVLFSYMLGDEARESSYWTSYEYNNDDLLWLYWIYLPKETTGLVWFDYDESGRLAQKEINFDNGTSSFDNQIEITYKASNNTSLSTMVDSYKSTVGTQETVYTYTYDDNGNITCISYGGENEITYEYDNLGQLIRENNSLLNRTYKYEYDTAGNIKKKSVYTLTPKDVEPTDLIYTYAYGYSSESWCDQLVSFNGDNITYDALGNPDIYYNGFDFDWIGRRLVGATYGNKEISFTYDDTGIRQSKTVNGVTTNYYWLGSMLVAEETAGNVTVYLYDDTGAPIGFQYRTPGYAEDVWDTYLYEKNLQGDIIAVYNLAGTKLVSYTYDAWGNFTTTYHNGGEYTPAASNPYTYRGYYYDTDLGLYYLMSRYYDSNIGRFINADDIDYLGANGDLTSYNLYAYCSNNPVMYTDETGHASGSFWKRFIGATIGIALGVTAIVAVAMSGGTLLVPTLVGVAAGAGINLASQGVANLRNGKDFFEDINWWNVAIGAAAGALFGTGAGGLWGTIATGALSNASMSALDGQNWADIGINSIVGGLAAAVGYGVGKYISNKLLNINTNLGYGDYVNMARVDGAGILKRNAIAFISKAYTLGPNILSGATRGISNFAGKLLGGLNK